MGAGCLAVRIFNLGRNMAGKIPYLDKKSAIHSELITLAKARPLKTITYGEFGVRVGIPARGPWKRILDLIAKEELARGLPDITFLVVNKGTGYPSQIGFKDARPPTAAQKAQAKTEGQKIVARYNPDAANPY
jgi:hypothetical protein